MVRLRDAVEQGCAALSLLVVPSEVLFGSGHCRETVRECRKPQRGT